MNKRQILAEIDRLRNAVVLLDDEEKHPRSLEAEYLWRKNLAWKRIRGGSFRPNVISQDDLKRALMNALGEVQDQYSWFGRELGFDIDYTSNYTWKQMLLGKLQHGPFVYAFGSIIRRQLERERGIDPGQRDRESWDEEEDEDLI